MRVLDCDGLLHSSLREAHSEQAQVPFHFYKFVCVVALECPFEVVGLVASVDHFLGLFLKDEVLAVRAR